MMESYSKHIKPIGYVRINDRRYIGKSVERGFIVYCREENRLVETDITQKDKENMDGLIKEYRNVLEGYYPEATKQKIKCFDCCYKNICIKI